MKKSEKLSLAVSVILFVCSAVFAVALLSELFHGGGALHSLGALMIGAYGAGSALIPLFLLVAGILSFLPSWSIRRWLLLASSIVPFFTIIVTEKFCKNFSAEGDLLGAVKIGVTVVICVLLLILEYLSCCIAADSLERWISDHFATDEGEAEAEDAETSAIESVSKSAETQAIETESSKEEKSSENESEIAENADSENNAESESPAKSENVAEDAETVKAESVPDNTGTPSAETVEAADNEGAENAAQTEIALEQSQTVSAEETPEVKQGTTTAMFSVSEEEIERAREAEKAELAEKKKLIETDEDKTVLADSPIENDDDSFVIVPVAEDEAAFITDDSPVTENYGAESNRVIDLSAETAIFPHEENLEQPAETEIEEKKKSVFDAAIEAVDARNRQAEPAQFDAGNTLDEDFFDIDMNAEDDDEREEREEREKTMLAYEDRPLIIPQAPVTLGEYDRAVSEPLNPVFAKMEQDVLSSLPAIEIPKSESLSAKNESVGEPAFDSQTEIAENETIASEENGENDDAVIAQTKEPVLEAEQIARPSLLQTAMQMKDALEENAEPELSVESSPESSETAENTLENAESEENAVENTEIKENSESDSAENAAENAESLSEPEIQEEKSDDETESAEIPAEESVAFAMPEPETENISPAMPIAEVKPPVVRKPYSIPTDILTAYSANPYWEIDEETKQAAENLTNTLSEFKIDAEVTGIRKGPVVTMFEMLPAPGVKLSKIVALQDNIALRLAAKSVRIVAPIPGKRAVGIEVPNRERAVVSFREIIEEDNPAWSKMAVPVVLGKDISGESKIMDLVKTPHLLIAGATGAGKSVCVNSLILSILFKRSPEQVRLILIDPKIVELKLYNDIPHLLTPVITEPKRAFQALQYCLCEMERRYALLDGMQVRDIESYNRRIVERNIATEKLPYIVVIIDEFADLMATSGKELETTVARLCAMSRAVGIHLVLATQRPSIDVITGLIKANIPSRIAFMVASKMDSRIIIDQIGAEKLLGKGDMLYAGVVDPFPTRIQGTLVNDLEVENVVDYVKQFGEPDYIDDEIFIDDDDDEESEPSYQSEGEDPLYDKALDIVIQAGKASASYIQRRLKIGYNRAARLVEEMEARGIVGPANGSKPREIIHMP